LTHYYAIIDIIIIFITPLHAIISPLIRHYIIITPLLAITPLIIIIIIDIDYYAIDITPLMIIITPLTLRHYAIIDIIALLLTFDYIIDYY
jgi:hypothetical protein